MSVIDPEALRTRRKTVPESAIEVLKLIQQQKDLPSTPANSLNSQNSLLKSQDSGISQTSRRDSTQAERRKTIPESAIDVLLELQQPNSSESSMKSDQASDPDLYESNENERKSTPASASNSVQEVQHYRIPSTLKSEEHLMTDTDGEAFSDSEEGKLIQKTSSTAQRRITRGKLHSFIKSKELLATASNVSAASTGSNSKKPCLSNAQSNVSVPTSRKSEHQSDKALLDESAENEQIDDSTEDMIVEVDTANPSDIQTAPTALEIVRPSPSHSKASTNLLEEQSEMENLNSSHIQSKISLGSRSTKSEKRLSSQHKASTTSIVSESAIINNDDDSSSLKFIENDVKESDDPHSTSSKISQTSEISIKDPFATSSRISHKSKVSEMSNNSVKSQGSTTKSISEDIYDAFMKTIMREMMENAHEEETGIPKKANSKISSAEPSTSVKKSSSTASRISTRRRSSKVSKESIKSRRSSTRSQRSSEENPQARTTSSIANSFVRHVLDDAKQNLREGNDVNIEQGPCNDNGPHSELNRTPSRVSTRSRSSKASNVSSNKPGSSLREESAVKYSHSLRQVNSEINVRNDNSSEVSTRSRSSKTSHQSCSSREESAAKSSHSLQEQRSEIKEINGNSSSAASINDALDTGIEPNKKQETTSRISTRSSSKSNKTTNSMSQLTNKTSKISTISENVSLREDVSKESAIDFNKPEESLSRISTRSSKVSEKSSNEVGKSRISARSRSSSKTALSHKSPVREQKSSTHQFDDKNSLTSKNERPRKVFKTLTNVLFSYNSYRTCRKLIKRTRSSSRSSKASSAASKAASIHSKISTRSSSRLKGNPANSRASSLSLSDSKNSQLQTSFSKISKMSNDESSSVPHKTTSKSTFSSKSPTTSQVQLNAQDDSKSVQESAISSRHSKLSQTELAVNSKSTISDCNKSEEQVAFSGAGNILLFCFRTSVSLKFNF